MWGISFLHLNRMNCVRIAWITFSLWITRFWFKMGRTQSMSGHARPNYETLKKKTFSKNLCKRGEQADFFFPKRPNLSPLCERHIFVHVIQKHVSLPCFCYSPLYSCDAKREWPTLCALSFCMLMCWLSINATTRACKLSGGPL